MRDQGGSARFFLLQSCQMCNTFGRQISCGYLFLLEKVSCIPDTILCEVYLVKVWEGMVGNSLNCHAIPKRWACSYFGVPFAPHTLSQMEYT